MAAFFIGCKSFDCKAIWIANAGMPMSRNKLIWMINYVISFGLPY